MVHSGMTGGGTPGLEHKFGKYLSYEEAVHEVVAFSVLTYKGDRFADPDYGTIFVDAIDLEKDQAIQFANQEVLNGLSGSSANVIAVKSAFSENDELVTTVEAQHAKGGRPVSVTLRISQDKETTIDPFRPAVD